MDKWEMVEEVNVYDVYLYLRREILLPGFNWESFPFALSYGDTYDIVNIKTNHKSKLILGQAGHSYSRLAAHFFVEGENGLIELHVCTRRRNEANTLWEKTWLCMDLNQDFKDILTKHGRLPQTSCTLPDFMVMMDECDALHKIGCTTFAH